ncbi:MAG: DUF484 family protein [Pseudomonadota bacterium]|nr:MAG: DUF484 family protein [Pseudomonadota bacterium]
MSTPYKNKPDADRNLEKDIVRYLRDHPGFFDNHRDLLADMVLPHEAGGAVSLIERQVSVLRDQKEELRAKLNKLLSVARTNEQLSEQINVLILALLDASSLDEILDLLRDRLAKDFNADAVVVRLFKPRNRDVQPRPEFVDWSEPVLGAFEKVVAGRKPVCGKLKPGQLDSLFADSDVTVASAALVPLVTDEHDKICHGLLAIGSRDRSRFHAEMGTLFLGYLGKVLTRVLRPHLQT